MHRGGQLWRAKDGAARAVNGQHQGGYAGVCNGALNLQACHLGADAAGDLHHQVCLGGHDTIEGEHGNTTGADFVGLLFVGQRAA